MLSNNETLLHDKHYIQQYLRVKRWYDRFEKISDDRKHDMTSFDYQDDMMSFFINCYHLKDWIKNDLKSGINGAVVEEFVEKSDNLKICGDLCNGAKHLLIKNPKIDKDTIVSKRHFSLTLGGGPLINVRYEISVGEKTYDAFNLAKECLKEWEQFLCNNSQEFSLNMSHQILSYK